MRAEKKTSKSRRVLATFLALSVILSYSVPMASFADTADSGSANVAAQTTQTHQMVNAPLETPPAADSGESGGEPKDTAPAEETGDSEDSEESDADEDAPSDTSVAEEKPEAEEPAEEAAETEDQEQAAMEPAIEEQAEEPAETETPEPAAAEEEPAEEKSEAEENEAENSVSESELTEEADADDEAAEEKEDEDKKEDSEEEGPAEGNTVIFSAYKASPLLGASGSTAKLYKDTTYTYPGTTYPCGHWKIDYEGETYTAYCVDPAKPGPDEGNYSTTEPTEKVEKFLYYMYDYPGFDEIHDKMNELMKGTQFDSTASSKKEQYMVCHLLIAQAMNGKMDGESLQKLSDYTKTQLGKLYDYVKGKDDPPNGDPGFHITADGVTYNNNCNVGESKWVYDADEKELVQTTASRFTMHINDAEYNKVKIPVPKDGYLHYYRNGSWHKVGYSTAESKSLNDGEKFYFSMKEDASVTATFPRTLKSAASTFQAWQVNKSSSSTQTIVFSAGVAGTGATDSLKMTFDLPAGELTVYKKWC